MDTQTDIVELFQFFMSFLKKIEIMIDKNLFREDTLLQNFDLVSEEEQIILKREFSISSEKLNKLQKYLGKISSLYNKGGDIFFRGLLRIFQAQPLIIKLNENDLFQNITIIDKNQGYAKETSIQKQLIKIKHSVGGANIQGYFKK